MPAEVFVGGDAVAVDSGGGKVTKKYRRKQLQIKRLFRKELEAVFDTDAAVGIVKVRRLLELCSGDDEESSQSRQFLVRWIAKLEAAE